MKTIETKELVSRIHEIGDTLTEALLHLHNGIIYNKQSEIRQAEEFILKAKESEKTLTDELFETAQTDASLQQFLPVPSHLERIAGNLEHIGRAIHTKVRDNVLFSDKALLELNFLFQRTKEILNAVNDLILAKNVFLGNYIRESEREIENSASKFTTLHEERLIEGICLPKASSLYIIILDSIKRIAWNARGIAEKLSK